MNVTIEEEKKEEEEEKVLKYKWKISRDMTQSIRAQQDWNGCVVKQGSKKKNDEDHI